MSFARRRGDPLPQTRIVQERVSVNDDRSPLLTLISCIDCNRTMRLEKSSPGDDGNDVIQYRCEQCSRIERVHLIRRDWPSER